MKNTDIEKGTEKIFSRRSTIPADTRMAEGRSDRMGGGLQAWPSVQTRRSCKLSRGG